MTAPHRDDGKPTVYRITDARKSIVEDVNARQRRYLISMGIRTVCFVAAIFASGWLRWVLIVAALVLPYVSVIFANAGREPSPAPPTTGLPQERPMLGPGPMPTSQAGPQGPTTAPPARHADDADDAAHGPSAA